MNDAFLGEFGAAELDRFRATLAAIARGRPLSVHQWAFCAPRAISSSTLERNSFKVGDVFALL